MWAGRRSWFRDWLRAGLSGDRIPVVVRFSAYVQTGRGAHPATCTMGTGIFPGVNSGRGVLLTTHNHLVPLWTYSLYRASVPVQGCTLPFYPVQVTAKTLKMSHFEVSPLHTIITALQYKKIQFFSHLNLKH